MGKIHVLDQSTINQIAAGEVIDRPVSVVKELLENAIDAGSTAVTVEIGQGGTTLIRVTDNGSGIEKDDLEIAFCRHTTSKITQAEDLNGVKSLGFRGEALSSIAAVARVELITRTHTSMIGSRYCIEGGQETAFEEAGAPEGTTIIVRDLFFNTPARRKFLKTPATEGSYIYDMVCHIALSHPEVSFRFIQNGQSKLHTSGNHNLKDVIYNVYGKDVVRELIPVQYESSFFRLDGFLGKPVTARSSRNCEIYFINGRFIKSVLIRKAIEEAYRNFLMQHKFPFTVIQITIDSEFTDVNVHPSKMELRFRNQEFLYEELYNALRKTLLGPDLSVSADFGQENEAKKSDPVTQTSASGNTGSRDHKEYNFLTGERKTDNSRPHNPENAGSSAASSGSSAASSGSSAASSGGSAASSGNSPISSGSSPAPSGSSPTSAVSSPAPSGSNPASAGGNPAPGAFAGHSENRFNLADQDTGLKKAAQEADILSSRPEPFETNRLNVLLKEETAKYEEFQAGEASQMDLFEDKILSKDALSEIQLVGQIFDTYWIASYKDMMLMIDQHAAHERVNYERIIKELKNRSFTTQQMNPPRIISLTPAQQSRFPELNKVLTESGFEIEPFGGSEYAVYGMPDNLTGISPEDFLDEILEHAESGVPFTPDAVYEKAASLACKASIKGNQHISAQEAELLFAQLIELENPYNCPHGRPVMIRMSKNEIEKKFKRIV